MATLEQVRDVLGEVLHLGERAATFDAETAILGNIPEFDSMAAVNLILAIEKKFGIEVDDDDITGRTFETIGSLTMFIDSKT